MGNSSKILVVEDELTNSLLLKRILIKAGYEVKVAHNGLEALNILEGESFDAILSDWMMPQMDGIELIRRMREKMDILPLIIMITALVSEGARNYAMESGADDYIAKPIDVDDLMTRLRDGLAKKNQNIPLENIDVIKADDTRYPNFVATCIATSTGGPPTLIEIFKNLESLGNPQNSAFYIVQHGPPWMLETFAQRLQRETSLNVILASGGLESAPGNVYLAPGDKHMRINSRSYRIAIDDGPKENFVRPSADPLFRSVAEAFGRFCVGVVLTGLGRDGMKGAMNIVHVGGQLLVQDPESAVAPSMPRTIVQAGIPHTMVNISDMPERILNSVNNVNSVLKKLKSA